MKTMSIMAVLALSTGALAVDLGNQAPVKPATVTPENIPVDRQGGDTLADAFVIPGLPFTDTGTTAGFTNDYDEACPYTGSTSPDVAYAFTPPNDLAIDVDLCDSGYDTKVFMYDSALNLVACNDDFYFGPPCFSYSSKLDGVWLTAGETYFIVIDGYGGSFGDYVVDVAEHPDCVLTCPSDGVPEGEPPARWLRGPFR